jgi:hypothetical protein
MVISELHRRSHCGVLPPAALLVADDLCMAIKRRDAKRLSQ